MPCHQIKTWRLRYSQDLDLNEIEIKDYRGLINPGCICYMNSLLQQLFMISQFRFAILKVKKQAKFQQSQSEEEDKVIQRKNAVQVEIYCSNQVNMLQNLRNLFLDLMFSQESSIDPRRFAKSIKTEDNKNIIKIQEQVDIDEFKGILFDQIQKGLEQLKSTNAIKELFGGIIAHEIISKECPHTSSKEEQFISITLQVQPHLKQSFQSMVKAQLLKGDNKYHCEKCNKKVDAQKIQTFKQLPPFLIICLKRFEFNYEENRKEKINDYCEFPQDLSLLPYLQQQIRKEATKMINQDDRQKNYPAEYFEYELRGVVIHSGSADIGHYYSLIKKHPRYPNQAQLIEIQIRIQI